MKVTPEYSSRFRILKGGKISLVVSSLIAGMPLCAQQGTDLDPNIVIDETNTTQISGSLASDTDIEITQDGSLDIDGEYAIGTYDMSDSDLDIVNSGKIEIENDTEVNGIKIPNSSASSISIKNEGEMSVTSGSASAEGIALECSSALELHIENTGLIDVEGNTGYDYGIIAAKNSAQSTIANSGTITVTSGETGHGILVTDNSGKIANSGTITVTSGETGGGILVTDNSGKIENSGLISVNKENDSVNYIDNVGIFASYNSGTIHNTSSGTITAKLQGELDKKAFSISGEDGEVVNEGSLNGNIYVASSDFTNSGTISLPHNAQNAFIDDLNNTAKGTVEIGLYSDGTTTDGSQHMSYSVLNVDNAIFKDGSTIAINVLQSSKDVQLLSGQRMQNVVSADTNLDVEGNLNIEDNSALLNFESAIDELAIHLDIVEAKSVFESTSIGGGNSNAQSAAKALDAVKDAGGMSEVIEQLNALQTDSEVAAAVDSTTPQSTTSSQSASSQVASGVSRTIQQRQNANTGGGLNSGAKLLSEKNLWVKPFGSFSKQNNKDGLNGFDVDTYGFGMGVDAEYAADQRLGVGLFYTSADNDVNNVSQKSDMDVYTAVMYGNVSLVDDKTNLLYQAGYSWQHTDTNRRVFTGDNASASYTSHTSTIDLKLIRDYRINKSLVLQPLAGVAYRHFDSPSYSESGAKDLNLDVKGFTSTELIASIGAKAYYEINKDSSFTGNINAGYDLHDKNSLVTSSFQGAQGVDFETQGIDNGRWHYEVGVGYEHDIMQNSSIDLSLDHQGHGSDFSNTMVSTKFRYRF